MIMKIPKLGCKFCHYTFSILELREYLNHLWRFHKDKTQALLGEISEEIRRVENIPK